MILRPLVVAGIVAAAVSCATAPRPDRVTDERELRRLHQAVIDAHLRSDVELLLRDEGEEYVVANRGAVSRPTREERRERLGAYLRATRFDVYRDLVAPVVTISADGSLGWVITQVEAQGQQRADNGSSEPLEFVSAWIELYEKRDSRWHRVGNVSNFKAESRSR